MDAAAPHREPCAAGARLAEPAGEWAVHLLTEARHATDQEHGVGGHLSRAASGLIDTAAAARVGCARAGAIEGQNGRSR